MEQVRHSDKFYMLVATSARLVLSLATFVVIVRYLGPAQFGFYAACLAVATVISAVTDFGLTTSAVRAASMERDRSAAIVGDALALKLSLSALAILGVGGAALLVVDAADWAIFSLLLVGMLANSLADLAMVAARVHQAYALEARIVVLTGIGMFGVVAVVAAGTGSLMAVAAAFAATRIGYLVITRISLRRFLQPISQFGRSMADLLRTLRGAAAYAVDSILTMLSGQIDVLVFATLLTLAELGTYQAGARLTQVIVPFSVMLSSVYLPALSSAMAAQDATNRFRTLSGRLTVEFAALSIFGSLAFLIGGPIVTEYVYGAEFSALNELWAGFAVFALLRFNASGFGIQLVALGKIKQRIVSQVVSLAAFLISAVLLYRLLGFGGSSWSMSVLGLVSFCVLGVSLGFSKEKSKAVNIVLFVIPLVAILHVLFEFS